MMCRQWAIIAFCEMMCRQFEIFRRNKSAFIRSVLRRCDLCRSVYARCDLKRSVLRRSVRPRAGFTLYRDPVFDMRIVLRRIVL